MRSSGWHSAEQNSNPGDLTPDPGPPCSALKLFQTTRPLAPWAGTALLCPYPQGLGQRLSTGGKQGINEQWKTKARGELCRGLGGKRLADWPPALLVPQGPQMNFMVLKKGFCLLGSELHMPVVASAFCFCTDQLGQGLGSGWGWGGS